MNQKVLPVPSSLEVPTSPPINVTSWLLMASPRPVPPYSRVVEVSAWVNGSKIMASLSGAIPTPVSVSSKRRTVSGPPAVSPQ